MVRITVWLSRLNSLVELAGENRHGRFRMGSDGVGFGVVGEVGWMVTTGQNRSQLMFAVRDERFWGTTPK
jgi:hypothetical protein